jgi:tryptophanyl-tRNA synthetase
MSLLDPTKKMSKSDTNKNNVIFLLEDISSVFLKIKNSVTDSEIPPKIYYDIKKKSGISNLLEILAAITKKEISILEKELDGMMYSEFKNIVFDNVSRFLYNLQKSYLVYRNDESYLKKIAKEGAIKARLKSEKFLKRVSSVIGLD